MIGALVLKDFFEAAAIVFFFILCEWVQKWCVHHTASMTAGLGGLLPETVTMADGGEEKPIDEVKVGEVLLVKPGGRVPVDGTVVGEGSCSRSLQRATPSPWSSLHCSLPRCRSAGAAGTRATTTATPRATGGCTARWRSSSSRAPAPSSSPCPSPTRVASPPSRPIAAAFLDFAQSLAVELPVAKEFELLEGEGVVGIVDGFTVHVGSDRLVARVLKEKQEKHGGADVDAHGHGHGHGHGHDDASGGGGGGCGEGCGHDHGDHGNHG